MCDDLSHRSFLGSEEINYVKTLPTHLFNLFLRVRLRGVGYLLHAGEIPDESIDEDRPFRRFLLELLT